GEDFHFYPSMKPDLRTTMLGIGCGVSPGLHHPEMTFNLKRIPVAVEIITRTLLLLCNKRKGLRHDGISRTNDESRYAGGTRIRIPGVEDGPHPYTPNDDSDKKWRDYAWFV